MSFQIEALAAAQFSGLFVLSDGELAKRDAKRVVVDQCPGFPCRISLADAEVGETILLVNYQHQPNNSPYKASHAIFIREGVEQARPKIGEVPEALKTRLLSVRAFNRSHDIIEADVVDGCEVGMTIEEMFKNPEISYLHLHNARPGCFAASVARI